ncbi:ribbon-helix-helix domain-containing protein [Halomicrobium urmianum]|uniref:ribbon-helix-helix domain-containing protein n=1 Tax=Halomicrobium urmianum TaxID=1586233 RepID=UPI001CD9C1D6|nr:CopG family transcriptional regulator [Halomicrobium urmianum]
MSRKSITVRIREDLIDRLDEEADERDVSRSEYIRGILEDRHRAEELAERVERLEERLEEREDRIATLEEQLARRSNIEEKIDTLAKQEQHEEAPFFIKWYRWWKRQ